MSDGIVKSTTEGRSTIDNMLRTIDRDVAPSLAAFQRLGDNLSPELFAGAAADVFYGDWPGVKSALQTAIDRLTTLSTDIKTVNANILAAGGNS